MPDEGVVARRLGLTRAEARLLLLLAGRQGRFVRTPDLAYEVLGLDRDTRAIAQHIHRIRRKLGRDVIETWRNFGARLAVVL